MPIDNIIAEYKEFREKTKLKEKEFFELLLTTVLKDNKVLKSIAVKGYTPGFNDGDPCVHSIDMMYPSTYHEDQEEYIEQLNNHFDDISHLIPEIKFDKNVLPNEIEYIIDELSESVYGTDWIIIFYLDENQKLVFKKVDYSCGH
jgi:hypothetical protein